MKNMIVKLSGGSVYHFRHVLSTWIESDFLTIRYKVDGGDKTEYARFKASYVMFAGDESILCQPDENAVRATWHPVSESPKGSCWVLVGFESKNTILEIAHYNSDDGKFRRAYTGEILADTARWMPLDELNG